MKYAGVGSRKTPPEILELMGEYGYHIACRGVTLRSGGAEGADSWFEMGCRKAHGPRDIILPGEATTASIEMASRIHPAWNRCNEWARTAHGRNCMIVLGRELNDPVDYVVCWTPGGVAYGGTATAIEVALRNGIPVYNWGMNGGLNNLEEFAHEYARFQLEPRII